MGPATGGATTVAQGDVQFVRWGNSGGYPVIALAPGSVAETYSLTRRAFDLAERFRVPVFLVTDKEMVMSMATVDMEAYTYPSVRPRVQATALPSGTPGLRPEETYLPWRFDPIDAPPPFSPFGGEHIVRFTGSTHDEHGMLTKDPTKVHRLNEHLWRKIADHEAELEMVIADFQPGARTLWISYGITARAMWEAVALTRAAGACVSGMAVQSLWPVPERGLLAAITDGVGGGSTIDHIVVAEMNQGQYRLEVERVVYGWAARNRQVAPEVVGLHRVDGELITPQQFRETL